MYVSSCIHGMHATNNCSTFAELTITQDKMLIDRGQVILVAGVYKIIHAHIHCLSLNSHLHTKQCHHLIGC